LWCGNSGKTDNVDLDLTQKWTNTITNAHFDTHYFVYKEQLVTCFDINDGERSRIYPLTYDLITQYKLSLEFPDFTAEKQLQKRCPHHKYLLNYFAMNPQNNKFYRLDWTTDPPLLRTYQVTHAFPHV
jgi:hypothetical protein